MDNHHLQLGTSSNYLGHGFHSKLQQLTREYIAKKGAHHEPPTPHPKVAAESPANSCLGLEQSGFACHQAKDLQIYDVYCMNLILIVLQCIKTMSIYVYVYT